MLGPLIISTIRAEERNIPIYFVSVYPTHIGKWNEDDDLRGGME
jgi:hypothetical protein